MLLDAGADVNLASELGGPGDGMTALHRAVARGDHTAEVSSASHTRLRNTPCPGVHAYMPAPTHLSPAPTLTRRTPHRLSPNPAPLHPPLPRPPAGSGDAAARGGRQPGNVPRHHAPPHCSHWRPHGDGGAAAAARGARGRAGCDQRDLRARNTFAPRLRLRQHRRGGFFGLGGALGACPRADGCLSFPLFSPLLTGRPLQLPAGEAAAGARGAAGVGRGRRH